MKGLFIFAAGLAVGAIAGAMVVKNKVMADAKEEIEEVREYYRNKHEVKKEVGQVDEPKEEPKEEPKDTRDYSDILSKNGYVNYNKVEQTPKREIVDDPYIIDPEDFGEIADYDTMTLTLFADGVLVDDVDEVVDDVDVIVGKENLKVFTELGARSVYIRNDIYKTDFEVLWDDWCHSDISDGPSSQTKEKKPHQV